MKKQIKFKYIWIALNFLILALPVFIPSTSVDFIGICTVLMFLLSYPLAMILLWLTFFLGWVDGSIGSMYLMLFAFSVLAYVQWFVLVPRALRFVKSKFFVKDLKINFSANVETVKSLSESNTEFYANDLRCKNFYDEQKRTPVERIFDDRNE